MKACRGEPAGPVDAYGAAVLARYMHGVPGQGIRAERRFGRQARQPVRFDEENVGRVDDIYGLVGLAKARHTPAGLMTVAQDRLRNVTGA